MATIFPNTPVGTLPPEALRAFHFLKKLPDDYLVWHHLAPWQPQAPDFLVCSPSRQALLVKVSYAAAGEARPAAQLLLLDDGRPPLGEVEGAALADFTHSLPASINAAVTTGILFANIPQAALLESVPLRNSGSLRSDGLSQPYWLPQEALQIGQGLEHWQKALTGPQLDEMALEHLRACFAPEVVVPQAITVRQPLQRRLEAGLTDYLLDFNQEAVLKADLDLSETGQTLSRDFRLSVVNGVAGSGKTLILLYRLRLLHSLYPEKRFLVLTHNRPLIRDMKARYGLLTGETPRNIEWLTFNGWCRRYWPDTPLWSAPLGEQRRLALIKDIWRRYFWSTGITPRMLRSEIDWVKDQVIFDKDAYMDVDRRGRGFRLTYEQRQQMLQAILAYQKHLKETECVDWAEVPRQMWRFVRDGAVLPPQYDAVLVDEAQFFAPLWFDLIRRLVRPRSGHLFVVADPTQGFLKRGASWKSIGLDVRGHTHLLDHSYRTTREILSFAALFYRQRLPVDNDEDEILDPDLLNLPNGALPQIIRLNSSQDEIARLVNEIEALERQGFPLRHILVLHAEWHGADLLLKALQKRLGPQAAADPKEGLPGDWVRVTTLNAGTGLESPLVFLVGLNRLFEEEQSLRLSDEEREELILENTRKVYMAATRAGQRLVITYVGDLPGELKGLI